jgi:hypothetical protein
MTHTRKNAAGAIAAVSITTLIANAGGPTHSWLSPVDGNWNDALRWDVGSIPGMTDHALLGLAGAYAVSLPTTGNVMELSITNPDATLRIENAQTMNIFGDVANEGLLVVNPAGFSSATQLDFEADSMITGSGSLQLNSFASRARVRSGAGVTVTQGASHTLFGFGQVEAALDNQGLVNANISTGQLFMNVNDKSNSGIMRASNNGFLEFTSVTTTQGPGGIIEAIDAGSQVRLINSNVTGGTIRTDADGLISISTSDWDGVSFTGGNAHVNNATELDIFNSINNDGTIIVNPNAFTSATSLDFETTGSFNGSGQVILNSFGSRARLRTAADQTMTNTANHTIRGWGQIEAALINDGDVFADVLGGELFFNFNDKVNNSLIQAQDGGLLDFAALMIDQSGGGMIAADGAGTRIDFNSTTIIGGQLRGLNGGFTSVNTADFHGVDSAGPVNVENSSTLNIFDSIVNNGTITVNPNGFTSATQIDFENTGSFLGNGTVALNSFGARARLRTAVGATMTNTATHAIRGWGQIEAALINNGSVTADVPGGDIFFLTNDKINNSTIRAIGTGRLDFSSITVDQTGGGELIGDGLGSNIRLAATELLGGDLFLQNDARVDVIGSTLDAVNFNGLMHVPNAQTLFVRNSINNNGMIVVNPGGLSSATQISFVNSGSFNGNGSVQLDSFGARARILTGAGAVATNTANHSIFGWGQIEAEMVNNGMIRANVPGGELFLLGAMKTNNADIMAVNESALDFQSTTINQGPSGDITADGANTRIDFNTVTINGGSLNAINGGRIDVADGTLNSVALNAPVNIFNARTLRVAGGTTNDGTIVVNNTAGASATNFVFNDDSELGGTGTIVLNSFGARSRLILGSGATMATLGENQRLEGIGNIDAPLTHNGTTAPGFSVGTMFANQPVTYTTSSVFEAEVNGSASDLLDSASTIELKGHLQVTYIDGFAPTGFWARKIMEGTAITEKFNSVSIPPAPPGFVARVYNDGNNLFVGHTCPSDTNLDGVLNFFDVSVFLNNYNNGDLAADLNGDGVLNFFDVSTFLNSYNMGC